MAVLKALRPYADGDGNVVEFDGDIKEKIHVSFRGSNNRLVVRSPANIAYLKVSFDCSDALVEIGSNTLEHSFSANIRAGQDASVIVGSNVTMTGMCVMSTVEGQSIYIGDDVMIATNNEIRVDDGHPIFNVRTGERVNNARSIRIEDHVWIARNAVILAGVTVGRGSVIAHSAVVTKNVSNNSIAAGVPARVARRNIAWERPHLSQERPFYKPDASVIKKTEYWQMTQSEIEPEPPELVRRRGIFSRILRFR